MKPQRSRPEGCLSDYTLDRRLARELDATEAAAAAAHVAECSRCDRRASELARERERFVKEGPALRLPAPRVAASRWPSRLLTGSAAGGVALAAAVLLFFTFRTPREEEGTRSKGDDAKLAFYVNHGGIVRPGGLGEVVTPGDGLRFVVTTPEPRYLAILSVDGARHASIYYPSAAESQRVASGTDVALPASTILDETLGDEAIFGIFCAHPFAIEPVRVALEAAPDRAPAMTADCSVEALRLRKEASPRP